MVGNKNIGQEGATNPNQNWPDDKQLNAMLSGKIVDIKNNLKDDLTNKIESRFNNFHSDIEDLRKDLTNETNERSNKDEKIRRDLAALVIMFLLSLIGCGVNISHIIHLFGL